MRGVRIDPERAEVPRRLRAKVRFAVRQAEDMPYRSGTFDLVLLSWSL